MSYQEANGLIHEEQNGFRQKRSCSDHIFTITSVIRNKLNDNTSVYAAYMDFRKAFDLVNRDMLLFRLLECGIDGKIYNAIKNIYSRATCAVRINDCMTDWFETSQGVKQGDNLSPTCFLTFINPLIGALKSSGVGVKIGPDLINVLAYADDLVLLSESEHDLQTLLDILCQWCRKWRLSVNIEKTKVMHFRPTNCNRTQFKFTINDLEVEIVDTYKYLGILLHEHLDFTKTAELLASAGGRALGAVINKVKYNKDLGYKTYTTLVNSCVVPILLYSGGIWGLKNFKCCEDVLLHASRFYMGVHRLAAIPGIQGDMGWLDCKSRWAIETVRLYNRFINMDESRLNRKIFLHDRDAAGHNWSKKVKKILDDCDMLPYWTRGQSVPLDSFKSQINDKFTRDWQHHCSTKPKLRTYTSFKKDIKVASHICCNMPKYERSLISQLRLGILPLRIETGRYNNLDVNQRTCLVCNTKDIEDEHHFLFGCNFYSTERLVFETRLNCTFSNMSIEDKFMVVFQHPFLLARYIKVAFNKRREKLYK